MLNIYTSTFCRPDYVQLLADAIAATVQEEYQFNVVVHPGGLTREWRGVHRVIEGSRSGYFAIREIPLLIAEGERAVIMHDDCVPVMPWDSSLFPDPPCSRLGGLTLQYYEGPKAASNPVIRAKRILEKSDCGAGWSDELCAASVAAAAESMLSGVFLHIDKGTIGSPSCSANANKPALVEAIGRHLGVEVPGGLTESELASHPGRNIDDPRNKKMGLGDMVASGLSAVGITKERVSQLVGKDCGCHKRQQALNELGKKFGIG